MLSSARTSTEIKQALSSVLNGFNEETWNFLNEQESDSEEDLISPVSAFKKACDEEKANAEKANREPDYSEACNILFGTAGSYIDQNQFNDQKEDAGYRRSNLTAMRDRQSQYADSGEVNELLRPEEQARHEAIRLHQATEVDGWEWVQQFRATVLTTGLIATSEIDQYLSEPAIRLLKISEITRLGFGDFRPASSLLEDQGRKLSNGKWKFTGTIHSSGKQFNACHDEAAARSWSGRVTEFTLPPRSDYTSLIFFPGTAFADIMGAADRLAERIGWEHWEALTFLLTGDVNHKEPVYVRFRHTFEGAGQERSISFHDLVSMKIVGVTLELPIWLSADTVLKVFRQMQSLGLGADNRPISLQYLRLYTFVLTQRRRLSLHGAGSEEQRRSIWMAWNMWCSDAKRAQKEYSDTESYLGQWKDLKSEWEVKKFAYFNIRYAQVQERLLPRCSIKRDV